MASIIPPGRTSFFDATGAPLGNGSVTFYIPYTNTLKTTYQDVAETTANTNPVILDAAGSAIIYGDGTYRITVKDVNGVLISDSITVAGGGGAGGGGGGPIWGGTSTYSFNAYAITPSSAAFAPSSGLQVGQTFQFIAGGTSTGASTLSVSGLAALPITKRGGLSIASGDIPAGYLMNVAYTGSGFNLLNPNDSSGVITGGTLTGNLTCVGAMVTEAQATLASATTVNLASANANSVIITGIVSVASLGPAAQAGQRITVIASDGFTFINSSSLLLPREQNLVMLAGDSATFIATSTGVWRAVDYNYTLNIGRQLKVTILTYKNVIDSAPAAPAFVKRGDTNLVFVECFGAGGAGTPNNTSAPAIGGGGAGGSYGSGYILASNLASSENVYPGAGGGWDTPVHPDGAQTYFSDNPNNFVGVNGSKGNVQSFVAAAPGTAVTPGSNVLNYVYIAGQPGGVALAYNTSQFSGAGGNAAVTGAGGGAPLLANGTATFSNGNAAAGVPIGGDGKSNGGGGGGYSGTSTIVVGGIGGNGWVRITEYS